MRNPRAVLGVIGGSGLYDLPGLLGVRREKVTTPFGDPSDEIVVGQLGDQKIAFLPRHGLGHRFTPSEVPYRANLHALKQLGVTRLVSVSAVGSMKEEIEPGHLVLPTQFIDRTFARPKTFFGDGVVAHVAFADPVCPHFHQHMLGACFAAGAKVHGGGTYLCIEGPQFSTRAESTLYRSWGVDVIGMTNATEARLAREAELCYSTVALSTDYDCWHEAEEDVSVESVVGRLNAGTAKARRIIRAALDLLDQAGPCRCHDALASAFLTAPDRVPEGTVKVLGPLVAKYFK